MTNPQKASQPTSGCVELGGLVQSSLTPDQAVLVEAVALRVVELLAARAGTVAAAALLTPAELAVELGVARSFVYEHQDELGVIRLGTGPKARLRFDLERSRSALSRLAGGRSQPENASARGGSARGDGRNRRRLPNGLPKPGSVLAIRGGEPR